MRVTAVGFGKLGLPWSLIAFLSVDDAVQATVRLASSEIDEPVNETTYRWIYDQLATRRRDLAHRG